MQVVQLKAKSGMGWLFEGIRLLRTAPIPILVLTMVYWLLMLFCTILPRIGIFAPMILTPIFFVGLMHAIRAVDQKRPCTPGMLFLGFKDRAGAAWKPLLLLGLVNATSIILALMLSAAMDGGTLVGFATTGSIDDNDPHLQDGSFLWAMAIFLLAYVPVQMSLWYAPLFIAWHGLPPGKALFYSLMAVLRNRWAFAQYVMALLSFILITSVLANLLAQILKPTSLAQFLAVPFLLLTLSVLICSFWPSYRDAIVDDTAPTAIVEV